MHYKVIGLALAVLLASGPAALADGYFPANCHPVVHDRLAKLGIPATDVRKIVDDIQTNVFSKDMTVIGVNAWVDLKSCPGGSLVVDMDTACRVRQVYTRFDCRIKGLKHF